MAPLYRLAALTGLLSALPFVSAAVRSLDGIRTVPQEAVVVNRYIVELESSANVNSFDKRENSPHITLYESLLKRGVNFETVKEWRLDDLFVGVSIKIDKEEDLLEVASTPGVKSIKQVRLYNRVEPVFRGGPETLAEGASPHTPTGVLKLHEEGIFGKGVLVAVIDTGIDYLHPVLGGGFGANFKVKVGYDFVGDAYDGTNEPIPDPDPQDCNDHGSHVAGIVAASGENPYDIIGVAPEASLGAYRVFGCEGSTTDEIIIDALLKAYEDGADVMNLSLGGPAGWTVSPSSVVASRLADKGIFMAISGGNDGDQGAWWSGSPGSGKSVTTVSSTENTVLYLAHAEVSTDYGDIAYSSLEPLPWPTLPIYAISTDTAVPDDACNPLPASTPDLSGFLVLIRRGGCTFVQKLDNAAAKGMKYALIYNNAGAFISPAVDPYESALISAEDGAYLVGQFAAGNNITISFPDDPAQPVTNPSGGLVSTFTSYGPTFDAYLKPSVAAPGGNILSSVPGGEYAVFSGTSMAAPYTAGAAALILSVKGNNPNTAKKIKALLQTTSAFIGSTHTETDPYNTLIEQGAGLIQPWKAIHYKTVVGPNEINLNDTANWKGLQTIEIENTSNKLVTYTIAHTSAGTAVTKDGLQVNAPVPLTTSSLNVWISLKKVPVLPRSKAFVIVNFSKPAEEASYPVYSGWITITGNNGEVLAVPYAGIGGSLKKMQVIDNSDFYFGIPTPVVLDESGEPQTAPTNYTFTGLDYPFLIWRRAAGTALQVLHLVPANINFDPTYEKRDELNEFGKRQWWGSWFPWFNPGGSFAKVPVVGTLSEETFVPRHALFNEAGVDYQFLDWAEPVFANGTAVPSGSYRFLLRVLKITGKRSNQDDYESYLSPIIGVYPSN